MCIRDRLSINRWGASQTVPDLFLQLNWMKSEWETLKCDRTSPFEASVDGFSKFAECAMANTKDYGPSPRILQELKQTFKANGVNLHIDAGSHYVSSSMVGMREQDRHGGKKLDYTKYYIGDTNPSLKLLNDTGRYLGERKAVFRVGTIGDQMKEGDLSTGAGITNGSAFYVANH